MSLTVERQPKTRSSADIIYRAIPSTAFLGNKPSLQELTRKLFPVGIPQPTYPKNEDVPKPVTVKIRGARQWRGCQAAAQAVRPFPWRRQARVSGRALGAVARPREHRAPRRGLAAEHQAPRQAAN
eukprot:10299635-Heterocapsa_arctica.AAC.1